MDWSFIIGSLLALAGLLFAAIFWMSRMPGRSFPEISPPPTLEESALQKRLKSHVFQLAETIGERNIWRPEALAQAADYIEKAFAATGLTVTSQTYDIAGQTVRNVEATLPGADDGIILVGAHYDTVIGCPGANDNASGVAVLLGNRRLLFPG